MTAPALDPGARMREQRQQAAQRPPWTGGQIAELIGIFLIFLGATGIIVFAAALGGWEWAVGAASALALTLGTLLISTPDRRTR